MNTAEIREKHQNLPDEVWDIIAGLCREVDTLTRERDEVCIDIHAAATRCPQYEYPTIDNLVERLTEDLDCSRATATRCQAASTTDVEMRRAVANDYRWYRENVLLVVEAESDGWRDAGTTADKRAAGVEACETILRRIAALSLRPTCSPVTTRVKMLRAALARAIRALGFAGEPESKIFHFRDLIVELQSVHDAAKGAT